MNIIFNYLESIETKCSDNNIYKYKKFIDIYIRKINTKYQKIIFNDWHSWDATPWKHPWLTYKNLNDMREFSNIVLEKLRKEISHINSKKFKFGFVGNIANNLYFRMLPLSQAGYKIKLFQHPQDNFIMSQPEWEEYDGLISHTETDFQILKDLGYNFPIIDHIKKETIKEQANYYKKNLITQCLLTRRFHDIFLLKDYVPDIATTTTLRKMDVLWGAQHPYYCYMSGRPYVVSQTGGEIWFECSRGDLLGFMQRQAYRNATMFLASNPWSYAHARRFGFTNLVQLPMILDETAYAPGYGKFRKEWEQESGGDFFVFSTSRLDKHYKNNEVAIRGFQEFCEKFPSARLVLVNWGLNKEDSIQLIADLGLQNKVIWLPLSGKARLREYYKSADCFFDQFVLGYYGASGLEAMASGLPVISRIEKDQYDACCATGAPPILQAETPSEVFSHLEALYMNRGYRSKKGQATREWFLENHGSGKWLDAHVAILVATALKIKPDFTDSPLNALLTQEERLYHENQLKKAHAFPTYLV